MTNINWMDEVLKRKDELISETQRFLQIDSVLDEEGATEAAPFGEGIEEALQFLLRKGEKDGFLTKNVDSYAGHIEHGKGEELLGILCHVDVVPAGDGWTSPPFSAEIRDGKIFARGSMDDKGPTMSAYYALKIVKELGLPLSKRVRIIIGTDEESEWRCVDHYFKKEEMPNIGFAPDADFPIIYAEKGIGDIEFTYEPSKFEGSSSIRLLQFESGHRLNMVPDYAKAIIEINENVEVIKDHFQKFLKTNDLQGNIEELDNNIVLVVKGISAHAMEPNNGVNAGYHLATYLLTKSLDGNAHKYLSFVEEHLSQDSRGSKLGIAFSDDITGDLTVNTGVFRYSRDHGGKLGVNIRFPVTSNTDDIRKKLERKASENGFTLTKYNVSPSHHVDKNHELIKTLQKVYEEQTGQEANLLSIGGGTYARSLESGVAFGPLFPGREDVAHQKDEHIYIEDLLKATAIYAQAIYELAK